MTKLPHPLCPVGTGAEHSAHTDGTVTCVGFSEVRCEHPDNEPCIPLPAIVPADPWGDGSTPIPLEPEPFDATDTLEAMRERWHLVFTPHPSGNTHEWLEDPCWCFVGSDHDAGQEQNERPHSGD